MSAPAGPSPPPPGPTPPPEPPPPGGPPLPAPQAALDAACELLAARFLDLNGLTADMVESLHGFAAGVSGQARTAGGPQPPVRQTPKPSSGVGDFLAKQFGGMLALLSAKLVAVLAPVALLAAAIGADSSGFAVFMTTVRLTATLLGTLLTPLFVVAGAALIALTSVLGDQLLPSLEAYYTLIIGTAVVAVETLSHVFTDLSTIAKGLWEAFKELVAWVEAKTGMGKGDAKGFVSKVNIVGAGADYFREKGRGTDLDRRLEDVQRQRAERASGVPTAPPLKGRPEVTPSTLPPSRSGGTGPGGAVPGRPPEQGESRPGMPGRLDRPASGGTPPARPNRPGSRPSAGDRRPTRAAATPAPPSQDRSAGPANGSPPTPPRPPGVSAPPAMKPPDRPAGPSDGPPRPGTTPPKTFFGEFLGGIRLFAQELRIKTGPQAQSSGIVEASKRAQMAALQQSPLDAKMLDIQGKMLDALDRAVNSLQAIRDKPGGVGP